MTVIAAIPARFGSARLPGKLLLDLGGRPIIAHVVAAAQRSALIDEVLVATDHDAIAQAAQAAGADVVMTDPALPSGSDRIGAALAGRRYELALNIQGDEPEIDPAALDALVRAMRQSPSAELGTLSAPLAPGELSDPNAVKVVCDLQGLRCTLAALRSARTATRSSMVRMSRLRRLVDISGSTRIVARRLSSFSADSEPS